jgi:hypothetical protein
MKTLRKPFTVQLVLTPAVLARSFGSRREALRHARHVAGRHRLSAAVWREHYGPQGQVETVDLVRTIDPDPDG